MDLNLNSRPHWPVLHTDTTVTLSESNCNYYKNDPKSRPRCPITKRKISPKPEKDRGFSHNEYYP